MCVCVYVCRHITPLLLLSDIIAIQSIHIPYWCFFPTSNKQRDYTPWWRATSNNRDTCNTNETLEQSNKTRQLLYLINNMIIYSFEYFNRKLTKIMTTMHNKYCEYDATSSGWSINTTSNTTIILLYTTINRTKPHKNISARSMYPYKWLGHTKNSTRGVSHRAARAFYVRKSIAAFHPQDRFSPYDRTTTVVMMDTTRWKNQPTFTVLWTNKKNFFILLRKTFIIPSESIGNLACPLQRQSAARSSTTPHKEASYKLARLGLRGWA